ncbi:hypothetical protein [Streptomyces anulatus]|uniref:hypothetical protein n=1 Tax=Streptomyces anulatus TaxID=1892 RepID=UPI00367CB863
MPAPSPADLWTLVDTTGDGRADAVVLAADGVRIFRPGRERRLRSCRRLAGA